MLLALGGCATLPKDFERPHSQAYTDTQDTQLSRVFFREEAFTSGKSGFHLLGNGLDSFVARAYLAHLAERGIDVQYYLYHDDLVGRLFTDQLFKAADRGVRIRVLVDDMDFAGRDLEVSVMDAHPHIEVRIFNPFSRNTGRAPQFVTRMGSVTRRMHNKSFTVDNQATILGGRNIGDEYFEADPGLVFGDLDVLAIGPVVQDVSRSFDLYWNSKSAYPATVLRGKAPTPEEIAATRQQLSDFVAQQTNSVYLQALDNSSLARDIRSNATVFHWGEAHVIYDHPDKILHEFDKTQFHLSPQIRLYWDQVANELIIFSPYFVPGKSGTAYLSQMASRGVRVRILTNSLASNDVGIVHSGYSKYRKDLLRAGIEIYEMNPKSMGKEYVPDRRTRKWGLSKASLHAKSFVFDRRQVFIGSLNLDPRSALHNTEIGVVISQAEIAAVMAGWFDEHIENIAFRLELRRNQNGSETILWHGFEDGQPIIFDIEPYTGFWNRFFNGFLRMLPIESQL